MSGKPIAHSEAPKKLTTKQRAFVEAYLANGFNATQAAVEVGYSERGARVQGHRLLTNANILAAVETRMRELTMSADEAMFRLTQQARGRLSDFLGLSVDELKAHPQSHLLKKVKLTRRSGGSEEQPWNEERVEYEIYDAQAADTIILKELHLRAGEATERSEIIDNALTDDERAARIAAILDRARTRRTG